ncbi:MAG: GSCFA domain-containing protein [Vicinamibacterales bacterium]
MTHPYRAAPRTSFWSRAISNGWTTADLITDVPFVRTGERVMTAGSCFAANLVPWLEAAGHTYLRTEPPHPAFPREDRFGYDRFTAAYGHIYTARQLLQLLRRASGRFAPTEDRWHLGDAVVDPFRPGLRYPARSDREFDALTRQHLAAVAAAFSQADVCIFTLGLTEAWLSTTDGAVFPACPGTVAGSFDPARHRFHNFSAREVAADLSAFVTDLRAINRRVRIILTVSPVPLVATARDTHVLVATTYSKCVLRVAAEETARAHPDVIYFPAYEIVTGPQAPGEYFEADRRSVSAAGIAAVMGAFLRGCEGPSASPAAPVPAPPDRATTTASCAVADAECEEAMADHPDLTR